MASETGKYNNQRLEDHIGSLSAPSKHKFGAAGLEQRIAELEQRVAQLEQAGMPAAD